MIQAQILNGELDEGHLVSPKVTSSFFFTNSSRLKIARDLGHGVVVVFVLSRRID